MPILERDPWRLQYFDAVPCPEHVNIPTDDPDCWALYPDYRWIYNKLLVVKSQGLAAGLQSDAPDFYPVFSKPNVNLKGMGVGSRAIYSAEEMLENNHDGHMWMPLLQGTHVSSDCAILDGKIMWTRQTIGYAGGGGTFDYWHILAKNDAALESYLAAWVSKHMAGFSGMMNFETIGGKIIEAHLRFADQWPDLYGQGWVAALVNLYANGRWNFAEGERLDGYSLPLFAKHGFEFHHPPAEVQAEVRAMKNISSLQITFHENTLASSHAMPPGGFRLAIVNATNFEDGLAARKKLRESYASQEMFADEVADQGKANRGASQNKL